MNNIVKIVQVEGNKNSGHGHVYLRPDGVRMRCGGPYMCGQCSKDMERLQIECACVFGRDISSTP